MAKPRVKPSGVRGPRGPQGLPGVGSAAWQPNHAYTLNSVIQHTDGTWLTAVDTHTSGATFNTTERAHWTPLSAQPGTLEKASLDAAYAPGGTAGNLSRAQGDARYDPLGAAAAVRSVPTAGSAGQVLTANGDGTYVWAGAQGYDGGQVA